VPTSMPTYVRGGVCIPGVIRGDRSCAEWMKWPLDPESRIDWYGVRHFGIATS
jgi:hypothetical protein